MKKKTGTQYPKITPTKIWLFEKINIDKLLGRITKKKKRGSKSTNLYMKKDTLQLISQKYKAS